ncbi:MAG: phosphoribosyltransferase [Nitrososphaerota archaeon]|nr:phosphoribosyltransferase [Nitrososphaerota archaeon]
MIFRDRKDSGMRLAQALKELKGKNPIILAIPRGGVPVAKEIADFLDCEMDLIITRKVGAPGNPEFAIGSVTQDGELITDREFATSYGVGESYILEESKRQAKLIKDRLKKFRGDKPYPSLENRIVVIVDDGIATGYTIRAAVQSIKRKNPALLIIAVPVAPRETIEELQSEVDRVVCLSTPEIFYAIGEFYENFEQVEDEEVVKILKASDSARRQAQTI